VPIDWDLVAKLAGPVIGAAVGAGLKHVFDSRPRVVAFLGHVSGITLRRPDSQSLAVGSHSVVLRNAGNKSAQNVRIGHNVLPDFQVFPDVTYTVVTLPNGSNEIQFPSLVPKKQITITYLYFPPLTWQQVNTHLETDDGPITVLNVLPTVQPTKLVASIMWALIGIGTVAILYLIAIFLRWLTVV
jgi:hypothetical protein